MLKKVISLCLVILCLGFLCGCNKNDKKQITIIQYVSASALDDACKIEHDLSNETFEAIKNYINNLK